MTTSLGTKEGDTTTKLEGFLLSCAVSSCLVQNRNYGLKRYESIVPLNKRANALNQGVQKPDPPWYQRDFTLPLSGHVVSLLDLNMGR